jgi:hypothetical protein
MHALSVHNSYYLDTEIPEARLLLHGFHHLLTPSSYWQLSGCLRGTTVQTIDP